jgi:hypothetical protein
LYNQPISKLVEFILAANKAKSDIPIEVFVHKAEKLQEEDKIGASECLHVCFAPPDQPAENYRQINDRVLDRLIDIDPDYEHLNISFHLTSVYDHSLHESFSKVLQKLVESLPFLEGLLNVFCAVRGLPHAPVYKLIPSAEFPIAKSFLVRYPLTIVCCDRCIPGGLGNAQPLLRLSSDVEFIWSLVQVRLFHPATLRSY